MHLRQGRGQDGIVLMRTATASVITGTHIPGASRPGFNAAAIMQMQTMTASAIIMLPARAGEEGTDMASGADTADKKEKHYAE